MMKRIVMAMMLIALLAVGASALEVSSPTFGDDRQNRNTVLTQTVTIKNDESFDLTSIAVSVINADSAFELDVDESTVPSNITSGDSASVKLSAKVPLDLDAVDTSTLKELIHTIGQVQVTAKNASGSSFNDEADIKMQAVNQIEIDKVRITCDSTTRSLDDGDDVRNLKPGEFCTMEVEVKNNFDDNDRDDRKIGDIGFDEVRVIVESDSSDVDVEVDDDISNLDGDEEDFSVVDIEIEDDAEDGKVSLEIRVSGDDENGAFHGEEITIDLDIERLTHDIQLRTVEVSPSRVSACEPTSVKASVLLWNLGRRDERQAAVEVSVPDFQFTEKRQDLELDKDDTFGVAFDVPVPNDVEPGVVNVEFRTFFDNVAPLNQGSVPLVVEECEEEEQDDSSSSSDSSQDDGQTTVVVRDSTPVQTEPPVTSTRTGTTATAAPTRSGFTDSPAYVALLVVAIVIVIAMIAVLVVLLVKRR